MRSHWTSETDSEAGDEGKSRSVRSHWMSETDSEAGEEEQEQ